MSGDRHGANLALALKQLDPSVKLVGVGGDLMKKAGVDISVDLSSTSAVGMFEAIRFVPKIMSSFDKVVEQIKIEQPDVLVPIDCQGFHMMLLRKVKSLNIPVVYYISPQEWQWGTEKGGLKVLDVVDKILAIFPEEARFYRDLGGKAVFVGHPSLDSVQSTCTKSEFYSRYNISSEKKIISIFPGSRFQEIERVCPTLLATLKKMTQRYDTIQPVVSVSHDRFLAKIKNQIRDIELDHAILYSDTPYDLIQQSYFSLITSGTVALEHAILGTPCIAAYRFSRMTYFLAKTLFRSRLKRIKYMTLPNLIFDEKVIPEFLQSEMRVEPIFKKACHLFESPQLTEGMSRKLLELGPILGERGVSQRAAREILVL